jgi:hypothetical protein
MSLVFNIALGIHVLSVLGILGMLLSQARKSPKKLSAGILHAAWSALVAALVMVGTWNSVEDETLNHTKLGVKGLVLAVILTLGYKNVKKPVVSTKIWATLLLLTVLNAVIAVAW